jgi:hypothetical protein
MNPLLLAPLLLGLPPGASDAEAVARGLAAVRPGHVRADLTFLADDAMRGRDTPSPEQRVAARYLRARVAALGFEPGGEDGTYFDRYVLGVRKLDLDASRLVVAQDGHEEVLGFGADYFLALSSDGVSLSAEGGVVYLGDGERDDFEAAGEAVVGRWALCRDTGRRAIQRRNRAKEHGAVGVLVTPGPDYDKEPYPARHERTTNALARGQVTSGPGGPPRRESGDPEDAFPQVYLAPEHGDAWIAGRQVGEVLPLSVREERVASDRAELENVCALWRGADPARAEEVMIVSAHYDHVGVRGEDVYNGADDNGSGTSGLLAVAEALAAHGPLSRSVLLIWVSGEEKGLYGSQAWVAAPTLAAGMRAVLNLNIDMIGRNAPERLGITPSERHREANSLSAVARELAPLEGFPELESADEYYHRSDQASFAELDIPVCFLFAGEHEDYHRPTDTADKIDYDKVSRVSRLIFRMLTTLDEQGF